jgi:hypothetical protein
MATNQTRHKCYNCGRKLVESKMYSSNLRGHNGRYYTHWFCKVSLCSRDTKTPNKL